MSKGRLQQIRMNALSAKILHRKMMAQYERIRVVFSLLSIVVPLSFFVALYIGKGTDLENLLNFIGTLLSFALIIASVCMLVYRVEDKLVAHKTGLRNNTFVASEVETLENSTLNNSDLEWFYRYVSEIDTVDNEMFSDLKQVSRQEAYREALKELTPGGYGVVCPLCKASPWKFSPGKCQLCGNSLLGSDSCEQKNS